MSVQIELNSVPIADLPIYLMAHKEIVQAANRASTGPQSITRTDSNGDAFVRVSGASHVAIRTVRLSLHEAELFLARVQTYIQGETT